MAPELLCARGGGAPADVYALAVTLNEAATGVLPFSDCMRDDPACQTVLNFNYGRCAAHAAPRIFTPFTAAPAWPAALDPRLGIRVGGRASAHGRARSHPMRASAPAGRPSPCLSHCAMLPGLCQIFKRPQQSFDSAMTQVIGLTVTLTMSITKSGCPRCVHGPLDVSLVRGRSWPRRSPRRARGPARRAARRPRLPTCWPPAGRSTRPRARPPPPPPQRSPRSPPA